MKIKAAVRSTVPAPKAPPLPRKAAISPNHLSSAATARIRAKANRILGEK